MYTNKQKKQLFEKIDSLSKTEHEEIYKIIKQYNSKVKPTGENENAEDPIIKFSKNKNGIFFNLSDVADELFDELDKFVTYCMNNKKILDDYDQRIHECKINNNYSNIIHFNLESMPRDTKTSSTASGKVATDWNTVADPKSIQKVANYIEKLMVDKENVCKKNVNAKFNNARKRYSKKTVPDKKFDTEGMLDLEPETYVVST